MSARRASRTVPDDPRRRAERRDQTRCRGGVHRAAWRRSASFPGLKPRRPARPEACAPGLAILRAGPCVSRRAPLNPPLRSWRHAVRRNFQQHHRKAWTPGGRDAVGCEPRLGPDPATDGASIVERRIEGLPGPFALRCFGGGTGDRPGRFGSCAGKKAVDTKVRGGLYGASRRGPEEKRSGSDGLTEV